MESEREEWRVVEQVYNKRNHPVFTSFPPLHKNKRTKSLTVLVSFMCDVNRDETE